jgi:hypothetical protein
MNLIITSLSVAALLFIWLNTNAFAEYFRFLARPFANFWWYTYFSWFYVPEFMEKRNGLYRDYLIEKYSDKFWVRLVTCSWCISTWIALGLGHWIGWANVLPTIFLANFFYYAVYWLTKKVYPEITTFTKTF